MVLGRHLHLLHTLGVDLVDAAQIGQCRQDPVKVFLVVVCRVVGGLKYRKRLEVFRLELDLGFFG